MDWREHANGASGIRLAEQSLRKIRKGVAYLRYRPRIAVAPYDGAQGNLITLGTEYGGWTFVDDPRLHGATVISCGLGEDASFDVEFARRYDAKVVIVDPTPRSIAHYEAIRQRLGRHATTGYVKGGKQPVEAYDLSGLTADRFDLVPKALWTAPEKLKFFSPPNPEHVSHSIVNYLNGYAADTPYIEVEAITLPELMKEKRIDRLELLKLDIEGAEVKVIEHMLAEGIYPRQLLVEFDELAHPSQRAKHNFEASDARLGECGYRLIDFNGTANFLYFKNR
ncbi:MAG TPA: FkbM family methyltransferase [Burkholderiaceae bacterium]